MPDQTIKLELTIQEVNHLLSLMGNLPFVQVAHLIAKIKEQGEPQVTQEISEP